MKPIKLLTILAFLTFTTTLYPQCSAKITCGNYHGFIQKTNNTLWVFGSGGVGAMGNSTDDDEYNPYQLTTVTNWQQFVCGAFNTFAIKSDGTLWGTGYNIYGQLGIGSTAEHLSVLTQIGTASNWKQLAPSDYYTIALKTDNSLWGWGQNNHYQMGDGSCCSNRLSPGQIGTATDWRMAAASKVGSAFAIKNNGTLWGWGSNVGGLLGDNLVTGLAFPTQHNPDTDWQSLTVGTAHILALKTNGTLWAWGSDGQGATANDGSIAYYTPHQIGTSTWKMVAAGFNTSYGIKTDGTLWAWGQNDIGQLGIGTAPNQFAPVQIGTDNDWDQIAAGYNYALALKTNGSLWAWGDNSYGQYGNGTTTSSTTPVYIPLAGCTLGVAEFIENSMQISPNPVKTELNIDYQGTEVIDKVALYDLAGKEVYSAAFSNSLNIAPLPKGIYVVVLKSKGATIASRKIVKE